MAAASDPIGGTHLVLDSSAALSWCFPDERGEAGLEAVEALDGVIVTVPPLWFAEVANALVVGERRGRLTPDETAQALQLLGRLPLRVDDRPGFSLAADLLALSRAHRLSAYDAAYLELALRLSCPLATLDRALQAAAQGAGVALFAP